MEATNYLSERLSLETNNWNQRLVFTVRTIKQQDFCCPIFMKTYALVLTFFIICFCFKTVSGQNNIKKIEGDSLIERLSKNRYNFIKSRIRGAKQAPPEPVSIIKGDTLIITFSGLDYYITNQKLVSISGLPLSQTTLAFIQEKITYLDHTQIMNATKANAVINSTKCNLTEVKTHDRKYFEALSLLQDLTLKISDMVKQENRIPEKIVRNWR